MAGTADSGVSGIGTAALASESTEAIDPAATVAALVLKNWRLCIAFLLFKAAV